MRWLLAFAVAVLPTAPLQAQSSVSEPPEFPASSPGPSATHPGGGCFRLATGTISPGDVDWVQVRVPWASTLTIVDVDFPANGTTGSAMSASVVGGSSAFNIADSNNSRDATCGLSGATTPLGSTRDSAGSLGATPRNATINIGVTGAEDTGFNGSHNQTFTYDVWVSINAVLCTTNVSCNDNVACTTDVCDTVTGLCSNTPDHASCNNGLFCDGVEVCNTTLGCRPGQRPTCDDDVDCTSDFCNTSIDGCDFVPEDDFCDDGDMCNGQEFCDSQNDCQPGEFTACDDSIACTVDSCDDETGNCTHTPDDSLCDNGLFCDGDETCNATLGCRAGVRPNCDDGLTCTSDSCDEATDACVSTPDDALCDDGVDCTMDACNGQTGNCTNTPDDWACDDGAFCNGVESCDSVLGCRSGTAPHCADDVDCTTDACDEQRDACLHTPDHDACDDGAFCNGQETCDAVDGCQAGTAPDCDDGVACTADACDEDSAACVNKPDDGACDDGEFCNGLETCDTARGCAAGENPCADGFCDETQRRCVECLADEDCDDRDFCNGAETCAEGGKCTAGAPPCPPDQDCNAETQQCESGGLALDIKPGQCPNRMQLNATGNLAVALIAKGGFDVRAIKPKSIRMFRADGLGRQVGILDGNPRPQVSDIATPGPDVPCACSQPVRDGALDLVVRFDLEEVHQQLRLDRVRPGAEIVLVVTGKLSDGSDFEVSDCLRIGVNSK